MPAPTKLPIEAIKPMAGSWPNSRECRCFSEITAPVTAALAAHPVFGAGHYICFSNKQLSLHPATIPHGLLRVMVDSDPRSAVAWLHRIFAIDRADLRMVAAVHGLGVEQPVRLSNGVRLLPLAAAPESPNLRALSRRYQGNPWSMLDMASIFPPTIAVFDMGTISAAANVAAGQAAYDRGYAEILAAASGFTLSGHGAPVVGNSWTDFVDPALTPAEFGQMYMGPRFEGSPSQMAPVEG